MENWIDKLVDEMGLGDTVPPDETIGPDPDRISILELIHTVEFSPLGWSLVRETLAAESLKGKRGLLREVMESSPQDFKIFMAIIQMPFLLGKTVGYAEAASEQLSMLTVMALSIMAARGYEKGLADGRQSVEGPGADSSEGPGEPPQPE